MTVYEEILGKIQQLPDPLVQEVQDFVDFLLTKQGRVEWQAGVLPIAGEENIAEEGMDTYLQDLEGYEERLAQGEIRW